MMMKVTNRGAAVAVAGSFVLGVAVAAPLVSGAAAQSVPPPLTSTTLAVWCADAIMADLDAAAEGPEWLDVPAPRWEWVVAACNGNPYTPGVYGGIHVYEDGAYLIEGYGDSWTGRIG